MASMDTSSISFVMGGVGLATGVIAMFIAIEIARRTKEYMESHFKAIDDLVGKRVAAQDSRMDRLGERLSEKITEVERTVELLGRAVSDLGKGLDVRLAGHDAAVADQITPLALKVKDIERETIDQRRQLAQLLKSVQAASAAAAAAGGNGVSERSLAGSLPEMGGTANE